jgi:four helix bundle protein
MSSSGLKRLQVWVQAKDMALEVYKTLIPYLPAEEKWGLSSQLKRAVISVSANIAEGYGRFYFQSNIQFCYNARGSLQETISLVIVAIDLGFIPKEIGDAFLKKADALVILLNAYISYLKKSKIGKEELGSGPRIEEEEGNYFITGLENDDGIDRLDDSPISILHSPD